MSQAVVRRRLRARRERKGGNGLRVVLVLVLGVLALGAISAAVGVGSVFAVYQSYAKDYVPIEEKLRQSNVGLTEIYDRGGPVDGEFLGALPNPDAQLLDPVLLEDISEWMIAATVATEDQGFWDHQGVNPRGLLRAGYERYVLNRVETGTGGSSITQQLIKNVYICPSIGENLCVGGVAERTLDRKLREIAYAIELEQDYDKEQILEWYLNQTAYADRYIGVEAAAQGYFRKSASELTIAESALLAGIPSFPTRYHPRLNCVPMEDDAERCLVDLQGRTIVNGNAKARQEDVIDLMVSTGAITTQQATEAKAADLRVYEAVNPIKAAAFIDNQIQPRLVRMCEAGLLPKSEFAADCWQSVHGGGYQVTTTLDWQVTDEARQLGQERIAAGLTNGCNCYNASIVTIDPNTGQIIVYVPNLDPTESSTDPRVNSKIDQATEINQPGSSLKPAIYLAWMHYLDKTPMSTFWDTHPLVVEGTSIDNPRGAPYTEGMISARAGLGGSQNVPAFRAAQEAGTDNVIQMIKDLGLTTVDQRFDPTFISHGDVTYGSSIATGGANVRVVDMAYMNSVIANMGVMVGVPHLAEYVELDDMRSTLLDVGADYERALEQQYDFARGNIRIPGTRELDPVVILEVRDNDGEVIFRQGEPERLEVVNPGSVWMLHSIMSDCNARYIIWSCSSSTTSGGLDFFVNGVKIPGGLKTGTQQGPLSAADTLETWMNGYSRHAATAVWVGNANNELVRDGPAAGYAAANTTVALFRQWMDQYHTTLQSIGAMGEPLGFEELQPANVARVAFATTATSDGLGGGCEQTAGTWLRNDVSYESECESAEIDTRNGLLAGPDTPSQYRETRKFVKLPTFKPELAIELARKFAGGGKRIPIRPTQVSDGAPAVSITSPSNASTVRRDVDVVGSVGSAGAGSWTLEFGSGSSPAGWSVIGEGSGGVSNSVLGRIEGVEDLEEGVYTIRLSVSDSSLGNLSTSVQVNIRPGPGGDEDDDDNGTPGPTRTPRPGETVVPGATPTPGGNQPVSHPRGFDECGSDPTCGGETNIIVRCGPNGWFIDRRSVGQDYGDYNWPRFVVDDPAVAPSRASQVCGN